MSPDGLLHVLIEQHVLSVSIRVEREIEQTLQLDDRRRLGRLAQLGVGSRRCVRNNDCERKKYRFNDRRWGISCWSFRRSWRRVRFACVYASSKDV
jgi:hypothetical protein